MCLAVTLTLAFASPAFAQRDTGTMFVTAVDPDGAPLPGVQVVSRGPVGTQTQYTGIDGTARFPGLYPGSGYSATFTLDGFTTIIRDGLSISADRTIAITVTMSVATVEEPITVTGESPLVDVKSTSIGGLYSSEMIDMSPTASGLWAGQRGSLLFWVLLLAFFSSIAVFTNRTKNREFMPYVSGVLLTVITFFLVVLLFADVNPFEKLAFTPADGRGLNPQLQNYWMTIHPPTLYLGFTSFTIPFAFAMSALLSGRLDSRWIVVTRRWTLLSWFFLANGIIFGMRWAYQELGWGGYWFWDPVENASLLPWLTATAFLHSVMIQEKRGMLKVWNMGLVTLTFALTIFATFLTRSGLIDSVHSFAQNTKISFIFLGFLATIIGVSAVLIIHRYPQLKSESEIQSFVSRESAFLFNNLMLLSVAFVIMWGILLPLLSEGLTGEAIEVGAPFFNRVNGPILLVLVFLMGVGPLLPWRRANPRVVGVGAVVHESSGRKRIRVAKRRA
ncbi:MAG: cytochrome c biogenesis protein CcsA, partial [Acidobacteria bacterium]|nr:cytochrome c biogenesis protein CcsA [Acidobacteriota bacterium]